MYESSSDLKRNEWRCFGAVFQRIVLCVNVNIFVLWNITLVNGEWVHLAKFLILILKPKFYPSTFTSRFTIYSVWHMRHMCDICDVCHNAYSLSLWTDHCDSTPNIMFHVMTFKLMCNMNRPMHYFRVFHTLLIKLGQSSTVEAFQVLLLCCFSSSDPREFNQDSCEHWNWLDT